MSEILPVAKFAALFQGYPHAYGTGRGGWVKEPPKKRHFAEHLAGQGPGLGIGPLREDGTVLFAAIDLDEPDFEAALFMAGVLPGTNFIERSRSGNAHVWAFFKAPIEAWIVRGIMQRATAATGKPSIEIFPKQDKLRPGMLGNYINLPYHGDERPIIALGAPIPLDSFLEVAHESLNDPEDWRARARRLKLQPPEQREESSNFGEQPFLHICAEHIIEQRFDNPVTEGHRAIVYFNLAKQLRNCALYSDEEAFDMMKLVSDASPDPIQDWEITTMLRNAEGYTSTGCDDPIFAPYAHPDCPIANRS